MSETEEIKAKLDIVDVIREYISVKAVGANFQALCPFHNEKSPSFVISPDKQIWHCFGCGKGGDVFSFVMEKEGLDFVEALHLLAGKAGVELKNRNRGDSSKRNRLLDIMDLAGKYYAHILSTSNGKVAKDYLLKRGLKEETITEWQLGYSPDSWSSLYDFLTQRPKEGKKYSDEEIAAAGLIIKKNKVTSGRQYYDRFRDRIMFPIWNVNNSLVAFTARINPESEADEKMGKYINSPQTEIYDKSKILFGLNKAKTSIREKDYVIVVEGQMDVISGYNHGFFNMVASSGTALTSTQVSLIKRFTKNVLLAFDMDEAGQMAVKRGVKEIFAQDMNIKVITLPQGKDPDECLKNNPDDFKEAIESAEPFLDYYFKKISKDLDLENWDNKRSLRDQMFDMIALLNNQSDRGYWLKKISEELDLSEVDIREEFSNFFNQRKDYSQSNEEESERKVVKTENRKKDREELLSEELLALILKFPQLIAYTLDNLDTDNIVNEELRGFYNSLIIYYNKSDSFNYEKFRQYLIENKKNEERILDKLIILGEKEFYEFDGSVAREELIKIVMELKRYNLKQKIKDIQKEISNLEKSPDADKDKMTELMIELKNTGEELKKIT